MPLIPGPKRGNAPELFKRVGSREPARVRRGLSLMAPLSLMPPKPSAGV